jgi:hypothetical protein
MADGQRGGIIINSLTFTSHSGKTSHETASEVLTVETSTAPLDCMTY